MAATAGSRRIARLKAKTQAKSETRAAIAQRAVGYIRVSMEEQATHGYGFDSQRKAVKAFTESQGYELVAMIEDPAVSGTTKPVGRLAHGRDSSAGEVPRGSASAARSIISVIPYPPMICAARMPARLGLSA